MKIATIIGARPQFIKAAAISRAIAGYNERLSPFFLKENGDSVPHYTPIEEILIHTGQHYETFEKRPVCHCERSEAIS